MAPVVHGLEAEYAGEIEFVYLDIDDPSVTPFKDALGYRVQPHYFLLDGDGTVVDSWQGRVERDTFVAAFESLTAEG